MHNVADRNFTGARRSSTARVRKHLRGVAARAVPFLGAITSVETADPVVALTFDDGPDPESTPLVLDILREAEAKATFFMVGRRALEHPTLVKRVIDEGHAVACHGWEHRSMVLEAPKAWREAASWRRAMITRGSEALGPDATRLYRPAYGHRNMAVQLAARSVGFEVVGWTLAAGDWADEDPADLAARVVDSLRPGMIVVFHDALADASDPAFFDRTGPMKAVSLVLDACEGLDFVTVPTLLSHGSVKRRFFYPEPDPGVLSSLISRHPE